MASGRHDMSCWLYLGMAQFVDCIDGLASYKMVALSDILVMNSEVVYHTRVTR